MKILLATGGSAGHIYPALAVAKELNRLGHDVSFAGVFGAWEKDVRQAGYPLHPVSARGFNPRHWGRAGISCLYMLKSLRESDILFNTSRPEAVLGFGGYGAFPVVFRAICRRYPTMIHEQNVRPGRANRLLAPWVSKVAISFEASRRYFRGRKTVLTGYPAYRVTASSGDAVKAREIFGLHGERSTLLVLGGSQGSRRINMMFKEALELLKLQLPLQVIHITGPKDYTEMSQFYSQQDIPHFLSAFINNMDQAYQAADVVVARAGAGTVMEIAAFGLPAVLIPYPYAAGHQKENAQELATAGSALIMEERKLTPVSLKDCLLNMLSRGGRHEARDQRPHPIFQPQAARRLAEELLSLKR